MIGTLAFGFQKTINGWDFVGKASKTINHQRATCFSDCIFFQHSCGQQ